MTEKYCPFKMAHALPTPMMAEFDWYCEEGDCAWWNTHFGMCSQAVDAHLKAEGAARQAEWEAKERNLRATMGPRG